MKNIEEALEILDYTLENGEGFYKINLNSLRYFMNAQQAEIASLKAELDKYRKPCPVCGGSGYRDINKTVSAKEPVIGVHIEHQRVKCSHCDNGRVARMVVSEEFLRRIDCEEISIDWSDVNNGELYSLHHDGECYNYHRVVFDKLTRLPDGMCEIVEAEVNGDE